METGNKSYVSDITDHDIFQKIINDHHYVIIDYYTTWCKPCKKAAPVIEGRAKEFIEVFFAKIDAEKLFDLANDQNIHSYPTIQFFVKGKEYQRLEGFDENEFIHVISKMLNLI